MLKFIYHKQEFLIPAYIILKSLVGDGVPDRLLYDRIVRGNSGNKQIGD